MNHYTHETHRNCPAQARKVYGGSGGIAQLILNRRATQKYQRHFPDAWPVRQASPVAISNQPSYESYVSETNMQIRSAFNMQHIAGFIAAITWHSQLHSCQHMKLNILLYSPSAANVITCFYEQ